MCQHLGIICDFDLAAHFNSSYSDISAPTTRLLTTGNLKSIKQYNEYVKDQIKNHNIKSRLSQLSQKVYTDPSSFSLEDVIPLNTLDSQLTDFMLSGEKQCDRKRCQRQYWSPRQREIARTFSYWKQKSSREALAACLVGAL